MAGVSHAPSLLVVPSLLPNAHRDSGLSDGSYASPQNDGSFFSLFFSPTTYDNIADWLKEV